MAQSEHLPICKAAYDFCLYVEPVVRGVSRYHKYVLGQDLDDGGRRVLKVLGRANARPCATRRSAAHTDTPLEWRRAQRIDVLVQPSLDELRWVQPDHEQVATTAFATAVVAGDGAVGGVTAGLTGTEVFGRTEVQATSVDARHGTSARRTYTGEVRETLDKMRADSEDIRCQMAARSFAAALQAFRVDTAALAPPAS